MIKQFPSIFKEEIRIIDLPIVLNQGAKYEDIKTNIKNAIANAPKMTPQGYIKNIIQLINMSPLCTARDNKLYTTLSIKCTMTHLKYGDVIIGCKIDDVTPQAIRASRDNIHVVIHSHLLKNSFFKYEINTFKPGELIDIFVYGESLVHGEKDIFIVGAPFFTFLPSSEYRMYSSDMSYASDKKYVPSNKKNDDKKNNDKKNDDKKNDDKKNDNKKNDDKKNDNKKNDDATDETSGGADDTPIDNIYDDLFKKNKNIIIDELKSVVEDTEFDDDVFGTKSKNTNGIKIIRPSKLSFNAQAICVYCDTIQEMRDIYDKMYPKYIKLFVYSPIVAPFTFFIFGYKLTNNKTNKLREFDNYNLNMYTDYINEWKTNAREYSKLKKTKFHESIINDIKQKLTTFS